MLKPIPSCKNFNGYKPCFEDHNCWDDGCKNNIPIGKKILIINLDAMGDVLMTTAQLESIKIKYPESTIHWITLKIAKPLLDNNPFIDKTWEYNYESLSILNQMKFDIVMNVDKSQRSGALAMSVDADERLGFGINEDGKIIPLNEGAEYNYRLGMDNHLKFKVNTVKGQEYLAETFDLKYKRNDYVFNFTEEELIFIEKYKNKTGITNNDMVIGFNTGCSNTFPNKKMTIEQHVVLIERFLSYSKFKIVLLGGPEDSERNEAIAEHFGDKIINTPTSEGVRRGACYESIPQLIITGDSFGMHLAIAMKKYVIAWFGLSCWTEIDLYDRGIKLFPDGLFCAPCWKKECPYNLECIQMIDLKKIEEEAVKYFEKTGKK
ncbi:MAG: lipopolysaccharide heptosyltransferase family protein [Melioribacteraceae bacterium]|nr:lipopolysaccharide heptosyltransferase family protein [Melioribacteraceae bacterium]MCF8352871.1 lipopolysaccharide heptosyltransferase family protein [Melioribacteraceae bacterium]MCF8393812.1 lipopolysaccharide heptosyltransferase family protein [Melioribacteraceae bacterium]MCF8417388.1 lipopolysaccharide heptosyltransferase family protein [Melioribacteraceae bacterium]